VIFIACKTCRAPGHPYILSHSSHHLHAGPRMRHLQTRTSESDVWKCGYCAVSNLFPDFLAAGPQLIIQILPMYMLVEQNDCGSNPNSKQISKAANISAQAWRKLADTKVKPLLAMQAPLNRIQRTDEGQKLRYNTSPHSVIFPSFLSIHVVPATRLGAMGRTEMAKQISSFHPIF
jgi:hypothetical protein